MSTQNPHGRYPWAASKHGPVDNLHTEYLDLYFDRYARVSREKPPSEEDVRLHALLYKRSIAMHRERQRLGSRIARFLRDNLLIRWLVSVRGGPR
jgi:hypothetical protein